MILLGLEVSESFLLKSPLVFNLVFLATHATVLQKSSSWLSIALDIIIIVRLLYSTAE